MNPKIASIVCLTFFACGCGDHHPASDFKAAAISLRATQDYWLSHGRPAGFQPGQFLGLPDEYFVYTNIVRTTNGVLHCRFGLRAPGWPPGVLAITDEGLVIFVCSTNGKVTLSPDEYGVDP